MKPEGGGRDEARVTISPPMHALCFNMHVPGPPVRASTLTRSKRERFAAFLGEVLAVTPCPPCSIIYNILPRRPMAFQRPRFLHNFRCIKGGRKWKKPLQLRWTVCIYNPTDNSITFLFAISCFFSFFS